MDLLTTFIYLALFIIAMVFVFSMAIIIPFIGRNDIILVIVMGLIIGGIGGAFLINPIYDEIPEVAGAFTKLIDPNHEVLKIEISSENDVEGSLNKIKQVKGFKSLKKTGFVMYTTPFPESRKDFIEIYLKGENFTNFSINNSSGEIDIVSEKNINTEEVNKISDWLMYTGAITTKYSLTYIDVNVDANDVEKASSQLIKENIAVKSVDGPVQRAITNTRNGMVDVSYVFLITAFIGALVALAGAYFDIVLDQVKKVKIYFKNRKNK
jgi:hypothetical protein